MDSFNFDLGLYRERLHLSDNISNTAQGLRVLQQTQLYSIPIENFDIQLGRGIDLDPSFIFEKLVCSPRGGYCFEVNSLFLMALQALGFEARPLLGRVHLTGEPSGRGHQISLVKIGGRNWIADVGFGKDTPLGPLLLELGVVQEFSGQSFRLIDGGRFGTMVQKLEGEQWKNLYSFDMEYVCKADIAYGNHYTSTSPHSFFTTSRFAVKPFEEGWAVLFNYRLKLIQKDDVQELYLPEGQGYLDILKKYFGIELDADYGELKPVSRDKEDS
ncbi:arylamine N-acetyltransferase family protein [Maridesulfovibrio salexigens]|uniref:N-acetyltransferase n=1 Tax=Maridesulfovibrio salexigens (strain ATCC 14822 / DSM 2638 / NCIMB 8403 / VKM B-1763) TaxID=526222 RepID=C6C2A7_MARSD|nr:arylamine N-acetyltransferase [Maridesulfovibrio salexigens]ACS81308.1 N-acetyltransferase [Maridesulfovibrio salexigens DSM 2638]